MMKADHNWTRYYHEFNEELNFNLPDILKTREKSTK